MKKFILPFLLCVIAASFCGCLNSEPYNRNSGNSYEQKLRRYAFLPYMYEEKFYAYYAPAKRISGPDKHGDYKLEFVAGPRKGVKSKTQNAIIKTYQKHQKILSVFDVFIRNLTFYQSQSIIYLRKIRIYK